MLLHAAHDENVRGAQPPGCKVKGGCSLPRPPASYAGGTIHRVRVTLATCSSSEVVQSGNETVYLLASVRSGLGTYVQLSAARGYNGQPAGHCDAVAASPELGGPAVVSP